MPTTRGTVAQRARAAHTRIMVDQVKERHVELQRELASILSGYTGAKLEAAVRSIAREFGLDPAPIIDQMNATDPIIVRRDQQPGRFGLDNMDACYQAACDAAGGEWVEDATVRGCKVRAGTSASEKAATIAAYAINSMECLARAGGGALGAIWDVIAG